MVARQEDQARGGEPRVTGATVAVRANAGFDEAKLIAWLDDNVPGFEGPLSVSQFAGGQSNPTFLLTTPARRYVMRRKPAGPVLKGAHAVDREARVITALEGLGYPVPHIHALCADDAVIGSWFYVMDHVEGRIFWDGTFGSVPKEERADYMAAMNAVQARLHTLDPSAAGLEDYGSARNYFSRQAALWSRQYRSDEKAGRNADMDFLAEWLDTVPPPEAERRVVHGDYRCDNLIFHESEPRVIAVLDWELSTIGDPLVDFAYHLMMYHAPASMKWSLAGKDLAALGLPSEDEYIAAYCRNTGREAVPDLRPYLALNLFRFAAILHGIKGRMIRGNAASGEAAEMVRNLDDFARIARGIVEGMGA
ncbi:phosphotransferase [Tsuneonella suprasediminis]|uniref:phosphotransferase n=1 Tax=Tsuneonella suprasediminis TaxID=2306996 RepID=UPI002F925F26